jgi:hypothetical protein
MPAKKGQKATDSPYLRPCENNIVLSFNFTATDSDGDTAPGSFQVLVNDDVPVTIANATVTGEVDEDGLLQPPDLSSGNADAGRPGETAGTGSATISGGVVSLNSLVHFGADGPGAHPFQIVGQSAAIALISGLNLLSQGSAIDNATVVGNTVSALRMMAVRCFRSSSTTMDHGPSHCSIRSIIRRPWGGHRRRKNRSTDIAANSISSNPTGSPDHIPNSNDKVRRRTDRGRCTRCSRTEVQSKRQPR